MGILGMFVVVIVAVFVLRDEPGRLCDVVFRYRF